MKEWRGDDLQFALQAIVVDTPAIGNQKDRHVIAAQGRHQSRIANDDGRGGDAFFQPTLPEAIARRAYEIYLERGAEPGHDIADWFRAEAELR